MYIRYGNVENILNVNEIRQKNDLKEQPRSEQSTFVTKKYVGHKQLFFLLCSFLIICLSNELSFNSLVDLLRVSAAQGNSRKRCSRSNITLLSSYSRVESV